jgi:hypothetical protein
MPRLTRKRLEDVNTGNKAIRKRMRDLLEDTVKVFKNKQNPKFKIERPFIKDNRNIVVVINRGSAKYNTKQDREDLQALYNEFDVLFRINPEFSRLFTQIKPESTGDRIEYIFKKSKLDDPIKIDKQEDIDEEDEDEDIDKEPKPDDSASQMPDRNISTQTNIGTPSQIQTNIDNLDIGSVLGSTLRRKNINLTESEVKELAKEDPSIIPIIKDFISKRAFKSTTEAELVEKLRSLAELNKLEKSINVMVNNENIVVEPRRKSKRPPKPPMRKRGF